MRGPLAHVALALSCVLPSWHCRRVPALIPTLPFLCAVLVAINVAFHVGRLLLGVSLEQAMDAEWVIRPAVSGVGVVVGWGARRAWAQQSHCVLG